MYLPENSNLGLPYSAIRATEYFEEKARAVEKAEQMRKEKIESLRKQIRMLEKLKFE